ncbi:GNAT family N-acetyltransferase [Winogradskyella sp. J14-2]|uniref:GNAT family N-acetyltransferase n=1 Tax=Winogradskyella sp. J14-2 TaxID=1936080 RepID=UPI000972E17B|nr:GNAT family N-acetyltransferase [Winogradskyella sp. J14-2]APY07194.1 GNAT family N-acetyltransferase [Winogradskyella sp. J14-2]
MKTILETNRLLLRELSLSDAENIYNLNLNPDVIKYTGDTAFKSIEDAHKFLKNYLDYKLNGYGRWAVMQKKTNSFIGFCGLKFNPEDNQTDIGFRFFEDMWNRGYATESARACLDYCFERYNLKQIIGRAMKVNLNSIKVLEKIGLKYKKDIELDGEEAVLYEIKNK